MAWNIDGARRSSRRNRKKMYTTEYYKLNMWKWRTSVRLRDWLEISKERPKKADKGTGRKKSVEKEKTL